MNVLLYPLSFTPPRTITLNALDSQERDVKCLCKWIKNSCSLTNLSPLHRVCMRENLNSFFSLHSRLSATSVQFVVLFGRLTKCLSYADIIHKTPTLKLKPQKNRHFIKKILCTVSGDLWENNLNMSLTLLLYTHRNS